MARKKNEKQLTGSYEQCNDAAQSPVPVVQNSEAELLSGKKGRVKDEAYLQGAEEEAQHSLCYIIKSWLPIGSGPFLLFVVTIANVFIVLISSVNTLDKAFLFIIFLVVAAYNGVRVRELPKVEKFLEVVRASTSKDKGH